MKLIKTLALGAAFFSGLIPGSVAWAAPTSTKHAGGPLNETLAGLNTLVSQVKAVHDTTRYSIAALRDVYFKYWVMPGSMAKVSDLEKLRLGCHEYYKKIIDSMEGLLPLLTEIERLMFNNPEAIEVYYNYYKAYP